MGKGRNTRKTRNSTIQDLDIKKIAIVLGIILFIVLAIFIGIKIKKNSTNRKISNSESKYKYFVVYDLNNKAGVIDKKANELIKSKYSDIYIPNPEEAVFFCYDENDNYKVLNERAEEIFTEYEKVSPLRTSDEMIISFEKDVLKYEKDGKFGLVQIDGYKITDADYESIYSLENKPGAILVKKNGKYGVLDSLGNIVIDFKYDQIIGDGYCSEESGYEKTGYITKLKSSSGDLYGYVDYKGKILIEAKYESIQRALEYEDDNIYLICMNKGKKGVYKNKKQIINFDYQNIYYSDVSNIFTVKKVDKYGFFNNNGKEILRAEYEDYTIAGNYISTIRNGIRKLYDINGNSLNNVNYISMIETENPEYFIAEKEEGGYCIIGRSIIVDENFINLSYAFEDYFIFTNQAGKLGVLKVWEGTVIEPKYDQILRIEGKNALEAIKLDTNQTDIYSSKMEIVSTISGAIVDKVDENYSVIYSDSEKIYINKNGEIVSNKEVYPENKIYSTKVNGKWGYTDKNGKTIIEPIYDFVTELNEYGYAAIATEGVWGVINEKGEIIVDPSYQLIIYYMPEFIGKYKLEQTDTVYCIEVGVEGE